MNLILIRMVKWFFVFGIPILMVFLNYKYPPTIPLSIFVTWFAVLFVRSDFEHYAKEINKYFDINDENIFDLNKNQKMLDSNITAIKKDIERHAKVQENKLDKATKSVRPR